MAWCIDGYCPAEIASHFGADPAAVRHNLAQARKTRPAPWDEAAPARCEI
jgi:hypothetical protein